MSVALSLLLGLVFVASQIAAQETPPAEPTPGRDPTYQQPQSPGALLVPGDPPALGEVVLEDPLTAPGALLAGACPTGRNLDEFVGEGFILKVTGKCGDTSTSAEIFKPPIPGLVLPDGEVRLDVKVVSGHDRTDFLLGVRRQTGSTDAYQLALLPARGVAGLYKLAGGQALVIARRVDLAGRLGLDDWNNLAVRLHGQNIWVLLNDQPVLSAADSAYDSGGVYVGLRRLGDPNDQAESAAVIRNLRVSKLARQS